MNKKISAVVTLVGLILIMCAMAVLFHNKKEDNLAQKSSNTVLSSLKEKIEEILSQSPYISRERRAVLCHAFCQRAELLGEIANEHTIKEDISQENDMIF